MNYKRHYTIENYRECTNVFFSCRFNSYSDLSNYSAVKILSLKDKISEEELSLGKCLEELRIRTTHYEKLFPSIISSYYISSTIFPLYSYLLPTLIRTDWISLVDWKRFYRDHIVHQTLTAYIVDSLLSKETIFNKSIESIADDLANFKYFPFVKDYLLCHDIPKDSPWIQNNSISRVLWKDFFVKTTLTASIFHDLGYLWQHQNKENSSLDSFTHPVLCNSFLEKTKNIFIDYPFLSYVLNGYSFGSKCTSAPVNGLSQLKCMFNCCGFENNKTESNSMERFCGRIGKMYSSTHGLPGALNFLYLHDGFKNNDACIHPINKLSMEWAASAIAMHDMKNIYWGKGKLKPDIPNLRIKSNKDPISAMVTLADTLQEFGRPISYFFKNNTIDCSQDTRIKKKTPKVCSKYSTSCNSTDIVFDDLTKELKISYRMTNFTGFSHKIKGLDSDEYKLFHPHYGFLDLSYWGVEKVKMEALYEP